MPPFPNTEDQAEDGNPEQPIPIDAEDAPTPNFELDLITGSDNNITVHDTGDEPQLILRALSDHGKLVSQARRLSENIFPEVERALKAKIQLRKKVNEVLRTDILRIEQCGKYHQKLKKLEEELQAEKSETDTLVKRAAEAAQVNGSLEDGERMERECLGA